jgi:hypothetical protein
MTESDYLQYTTWWDGIRKEWEAKGTVPANYLDVFWGFPNKGFRVEDSKDAR